jgi:REP element-mobilizing transposase RayT
VKACRRSFEETCAALGITLVACEFGPDHAHVFVGNCKNYAVPTMVQRLKGASSRRKTGTMGQGQGQRGASRSCQAATSTGA